MTMTCSWKMSPKCCNFNWFIKTYLSLPLLALIPTYDIWSNNENLIDKVPSAFSVTLASLNFTGPPILNYTFVKKFDGHTNCEYKSLIFGADIM